MTVSAKESVEVLRLDPVVLEDPPGTEAHDVAGDVADRPHQPPPESVVQPSGPPGCQTRRDQFFVTETLSAQLPGQLLALPW